MRQVQQLFKHDPESGISGDCFRACVASLLEADPTEIPHVHGDITDEAWEQMYRDWLHARGWRWIALPLRADSVEQALSVTAKWADGLPHIFGGIGRRGYGHVVIAQQGKIIHDPGSPPTDPYIGRPTDGLFWCSFLVPSQ
jgi:hypothetical protein